MTSSGLECEVNWIRVWSLCCSLQVD